MKALTKRRIIYISMACILIAIIIWMFAINIEIRSIPTDGKATISKVIALGGISVFEDHTCRREIQSINWGNLESNHSYSQIVYVRNDNKEERLDWGKRDIVWQRENVKPSSVYLSIKINYGDTKIKANEIRQANITLTVLGLLDDSSRLDSTSDTPQFTFDLKLMGKDLNPLFPPIPRTYALRDANNITVVYKDELKETVLVVTEIGIWKTKGGEQIIEVIWKSTKYVPEFTETWLEAYVYISYQIIVTINHERYGTYEWRQYAIGQIGCEPSLDAKATCQE